MKQELNRTISVLQLLTTHISGVYNKSKTLLTKQQYNQLSSKANTIQLLLSGVNDDTQGDNPTDPDEPNEPMKPSITYAYTVTCTRNDKANGNYYSTGEIFNGIDSYTNGECYIWYDSDRWMLTENKYDDTVEPIDMCHSYSAGFTRQYVPTYGWDYGTIVQAYTGNSTSTTTIKLKLTNTNLAEGIYQLTNQTEEWQKHIYDNNGVLIKYNQNGYWSISSSYTGQQYFILYTTDMSDPAKPYNSNGTSYNWQYHGQPSDAKLNMVVFTTENYAGPADPVNNSYILISGTLSTTTAVYAIKYYNSNIQFCCFFDNVAKAWCFNDWKSDTYENTLSYDTTFGNYTNPWDVPYDAWSQPMNVIKEF